MEISTIRTILITIGTAMIYISCYFVEDYFFVIVAAGLTLWGCYLWTKLKGRCWAFMFWGLLTPVGLLGISLLRNKSLTITPKAPKEAI